MLPTSRTIRLTSPLSIYKSGEPVGKSCAQVGRPLRGEIISSDSGIYDKWAQALDSADDLTYLARKEVAEALTGLIPPTTEVTAEDPGSRNGSTGWDRGSWTGAAGCWR